LEIARWREIQSAGRDLASPYLTPQYVAAVASVRPGIRVAVMEDGNRVEGFFPYQDVAPGVAEAVGDKISDCHAVIVGPDFAWTAEDLLRGAKLNAWDYRRVPLSQAQFHPYHTETFRSPLVDLSAGFEAYAAARGAGHRPAHCNTGQAGDMPYSGSRILVKAAAAKARLERAEGPLQYEAQCPDVAALQALMHCKSEQYRRTGYFDRFELRWVAALLERLQATSEQEFAGMLSVLWAGGRIAAAHFGMRTTTVWNYWFPCFERDFAHFSPGLILLVEILRSAADTGIQVVELGAGDAQYKDRFANSARVLAKGTATASPLEPGA
jgi:CelD/BcsL family acetyltransferase involved in cellulose biosynthesis